MNEVPLRRLAEVSYGLGQPPPPADTGIPILRATNIERGRIVAEGLIFSALEDLPLERAPLLREGEVLVVRSGAYTGDSALITSEWAGASPGYDLRVTPNESVDPRFIAYTLLSRRALEAMWLASSRAAQPHLNAEELGAVPVAEASPSHQRAIADFLDIETARIDTLIAKKRRMMALIEEREGAFVEKLLTDAADEELPLRRLLRELPVYGAGEAGMDGDVAWPRYIRITDVDDEGALRSDNILRLAPDVARPYLLKEGDMLLARSGATVGKSFLHKDYTGPAAFAGYLIRFRADRDKILPELLLAWTRTRHYWSQVRLAALQATIENVSAEKYKDFLVPLPSPAEQPGLARRIAAMSSQVRTGRQNLKQQIALLQEHRQALITAAVTGEMQVPEVAG